MIQVQEDKEHNWPDELGLVEWFLVDEHERVEQVLDDMRAIGATRLRTGIHWADCHRPDGPAWYDWLLPRLAREVELLPCVTYTPPSIGQLPEVNAPPRELKAYADFMDEVLTRWGTHFDHVELWNEPNNQTDWDFRIDPDWSQFSGMVGAAAKWCRERGWKTVLGGMSPPDPAWLQLVGQHGLLQHIDVVGVHGFPGTWDFGPWQGWNVVLEESLEAFRMFNPDGRIWISEAGYSTVDGDEVAQVDLFADVVSAGAERAYWYAVHDLDPERDHQGGGFHSDERHYHLGLKTAGGDPKLLYRLLQESGVAGIVGGAVRE